MEKKCNSGQWWNSDKCQCEYKKRHVCEKICILNPATCSCENGKYLASIMDDSAITCDEIKSHMAKKQKLFQQILMKKKQPLKCKTSIFSLHFY